MFNISKLSYFWLLIYSVVLAMYAWWSFGLTDPNLVLTSWQPYWNFQQWMWQTLFSNHQLLTGLYVGIMIAAVLAWWGLIRSLPKTLNYSQLVGLILVLALPLLFSYNALSHDVFNYMFNAKMVVKYQTDPHIHVALEFPQDDWTRFMHNTHTPAPYGYGWTAMSLVPYLLGMGKFSVAWFMFRVANVAALPLLLWLMAALAKHLKLPFYYVDAAVIFLNPLVLIEMISSSHNDLWMLILAVAAFVIVYRYVSSKVAAISIAAILFLWSVSTKVATITMLPLGLLNLWAVYGHEVPKKFVPKWLKAFLDWLWNLGRSNFGLITSVLLFLPLLTPRSQWFHPWYLVWSFMWIPLLTNKWWRTWLLCLSISSLFRYVPWLMTGGFTDEVLRQQHAITWIGAMLGFLAWMAWSSLPRQSDRL